MLVTFFVTLMRAWLGSVDLNLEPLTLEDVQCLPVAAQTHPLPALVTGPVDACPAGGLKSATPSKGRHRNACPPCVPRSHPAAQSFQCTRVGM